MTLDEFKILVEKAKSIISRTAQNNIELINQDGVKFQFIIKRNTSTKPAIMPRLGGRVNINSFNTNKGYKNPILRCITLTNVGKIIEIEGAGNIHKELTLNGKIDLVMFSLEEFILKDI
jgi:hypothetical protein